MTGPGSSTTLRLVLRDLDRTSRRELLRTAVRELVATGVYSLAEDDVRGRWSSRRRLLLLGAEQRPTGLTLVLVTRIVGSAPRAQPGRGWELREVARGLAADREGCKDVLAAALRELTAAGLVQIEERTFAWVFTRTVHVRTAAGEAVLRAGRRRRSVGDAGWVAGGDGGDGDEDLDSSFDSSFDASFDSGFSGGEGGGGDGGGGDGGGGGE